MVSIGRRQWTPGSDGRLASLRLPWIEFLALHIHLTLPNPWGETAVGLLGVARRRVLRDAFVLRLGGGRRLQEADLHNRIGVWGLPFHLPATLTGALFGLAGLLTSAIGALRRPAEAARVAGAMRGTVVAADPRPRPCLH